MTLEEALRVLGCERDCTVEEVRRRYLDLARATHPDHHHHKQEDHSTTFNQLHEAYTTAMNEMSHAASLASRAIDVDLDSMEFDSQLQLFFTTCSRCGDKLVVTCEALDEGANLFPCSSCSLMVRVLLNDNAD
jgi:exonuclease VII large subunit